MFFPLKLNLVCIDTGIFHYAIQVVPTQHNFLNRTYSSSNQYSYTDRSVKVCCFCSAYRQPPPSSIRSHLYTFLQASDMLFGVQLQGQQFKDNFGLVFTYDFYPVCLFSIVYHTYLVLTLKLSCLIDYVAG